MSEFKKFKQAVQKQIDSMIRNSENLFLTDVPRQELWDKYLDSFPKGTNNIYKERREYDCNSCKQFIRPFSNVVAINDKNEFVSIWDIEEIDHPYYNIVAKEMSAYVKLFPIKDIFFSQESNIGTDINRQQLEDKTVIEWEHFYYKLPKQYVKNNGSSIESLQAPYRDSKNVFKRSMEELTLDSGITILELIDQGSLYRGEEHKANIEKFIQYKKAYELLPENEKDIWCWKNSFNNSVCRIRNTALGTLLIDLSEGVEIDVAVTKFEKVMAPTNYKRPKAIYTKKMVEEAQKKIEELGYQDSLERRFAQLEDITVNNVIFVNRDSQKKMKDSSSIFDDLKKEVPVNSKKFDKVEEISIEDFINNVIPKSNNIELMIENKHKGNFMSLVAPKNIEAPSMLKWNNNFSWSYNGDIADSIKQNVKNAGGNVEGVLRFSIQWNENGDNKNDFDAHCIEPNRNHIFFQNKGHKHLSSGMLDVDIVNPSRQCNGSVAVENIFWSDINKMQEGQYVFYVHNFAHRGGRSGFSAEIEYDGQIYTYEYNKELRQGERVVVAKINFNKKTGIEFIESLDSSMSSKEIWNIKTNNFTKVSALMYSPNYWDDQQGIGNKHYFFFLEDCKNEGLPRGFFNEFLKEELTPYRKVFEALGSKMRVEDSNNQLSGVGFSSTQKNSILVKVEGSFTRVLRINF